MKFQVTVPHSTCKQRLSRRRSQPGRCGAIIPLIAVMLPVLLLIAGFGLYIANAQLVRSELRTAVDFSARAGAKTLSMEQSQGAAIAAAIDVASRNRIVGQPLSLTAAQITLGESRQNGGPNSRFEFSAGGSRINSVQVQGTSSGNAGVTGFFGSLAGVTNTDFTIPSTATNLDRDICVVIDRSGSMTQPVQSTNNGTAEPCGPLPANTRFAALARAVDVFINELNDTPQQEQVCLASYSSNVNVACNCCPTRFNPCNGISARCRGRTQYRIQFREAEIHSSLTFDPAALRGPIQQMLSRGIAGGTAIGSGLSQGIAAVTGPGSRPFAFPTIVLLTDGNHNTGISPDIIAQQAKNQEIVVHTITFSRGADQALMQQVAGITGGKHLHADDAGDLNEAFREIALTLPVMLTN